MSEKGVSSVSTPTLSALLLPSAPFDPGVSVLQVSVSRRAALVVPGGQLKYQGSLVGEVSVHVVMGAVLGLPVMSLVPRVLETPSWVGVVGGTVPGPRFLRRGKEVLGGVGGGCVSVPDPG